MRRKKLEYNFCQNVEWLESPENHGLVLPYHRLFCPNLSKSAPCKCCGHTTQSNCTDCLAALPSTMHLSDSTQSHSVANNTAKCFVSNCTQGQRCFNDSNFLCSGFNPCPGTSASITTCVSYSLGCASSPSPHVTLLLEWPICASGGNAPCSPPGSSGCTGSNNLGVAGDNLPLDCGLSSSLVFHVTSTANSPWPSGATITIST